MITLDGLYSTQLTLDKVTKNPEYATFTLVDSLEHKIVLRPLMSDDVNELAVFLEGLSMQTRLYHSFTSYGIKEAREMCKSINVYDKLRLVVDIQSKGHNGIIGVFMFSFDLAQSDIERYRGYGIELDNDTDCRISPCLADEYQNMGLGSLVMPHMADVARRFGQNRILLLGGVLTSNHRAIRFYEKNGFNKMGAYVNSDGHECFDMVLTI
jgi:GNAT superfamily N-acetyltransferase